MSWVMVVVLKFLACHGAQTHDPETRCPTLPGQSQLDEIAWEECVVRALGGSSHLCVVVHVWPPLLVASVSVALSFCCD